MLTRGWTITALGHALHDDLLFLRLARSIVSGDWLGPYDQLTLVKGPFYPVWIAALHVLGWPLLLAQQVLYVAACAALATSLRPLLPRIGAVAVYCALLFNPSSHTDLVMTRVSREGLYASAAMLVVAGAIGLLGRLGGGTAWAGAWAIGLGVALSAFWLTREEGLWLLPAVVVLLGACAWRAWPARRRDHGRSLALCLLPLAIWGAAIAAVATLNRARYGIFATVELKSRDFLAAYGSLVRVGDPAADPLVPVPRTTRERLYAVSPAFAELSPFLEGDVGRGWSATSCAVFSVCNDIGGGWFLWALRDAAAAAGHHRSAYEAAAYYRTLSAEVNQACQRGALRCGPERQTLAPAWRREQTRTLLRAVLRAALALVRFEGFDPVPSPSMGPEESLRPFRELIEGRLSPRHVIRGWAFSPGGPTQLELRRSDAGRSLYHVRRFARPDVYRLFRPVGMSPLEAASAGFEITTTCKQGCELLVESTQGLLRRVPLAGSAQSIVSPSLYVVVESMGYEPASTSLNADSLGVAVQRGVKWAYGAVVPWLVLAGLSAYAAGLLRARGARELDPSLWIGTALLSAIAVRLVLLSLLHVTSFPTLGIGHLAPAHPLLLVFGIVILADPVWRRVVKAASTTRGNGTMGV